MDKGRTLEILFYHQMKRINKRCAYTQARPVLEGLANFMLMNGVEYSTLLRLYTDITRQNRPKNIESVHNLIDYGFTKTDISRILSIHFVTVDDLGKKPLLERHVKKCSLDQRQLEIVEKFLHVTGVFYDMFVVGAFYGKIQ